MRSDLSRALGTVRRAVLGGVAAACMVAGASSAAAVGGPVIIGGDDLTDHGSVNTITGELEDGWLYIEKALANISPKVVRPNDWSVAALGSAEDLISTGGNAGAAIGRAAAKNGLSVAYYNGEAAIRGFFTQLQSGLVNPRIIWIAGDGAGNDLLDNGPGDNEYQALIDNAGAINDFVNAGGGLMSHGTARVYGIPGDPNQNIPAVPGWLTTLLPGIVVVDDGAGTGDLGLTPAGNVAFPGLTDGNVSAGPWHNHFRGDLGGLEVLAVSKSVPRDAQAIAAAALEPGVAPAQVILGGGQVSLTLKPADMGITKTGSPAQVTQGQNVTYTMAVTNNGPNPATAVTVTDTLPAGATLVSAGATAGSCSGTATVTCALGDMASGATGTVTTVARMDQTGTLTNTAKVASGVPDTNPANDQASAQTTVVVAPPAPPLIQATAAPSRARLSISKTGPLTSRAGQKAVYRITVRNTSKVAATRVVLRDELGSGMGLASRPRGAKISNARVSWSLGTLRAGASKTVSITIRFDRNTGGLRCNGAVATAANARRVRDTTCTRVAAVAAAVLPPVTG